MLIGSKHRLVKRVCFEKKTGNNTSYTTQGLTRCFSFSPSYHQMFLSLKSIINICYSFGICISTKQNLNLQECWYSFDAIKQPVFNIEKLIRGEGL